MIRYFLGLFVGLVLASCATTTVEACFFSEKYGRACATYSKADGLKFSIDVTDKPELRAEIEKWAASLGWKRGE